MKTTIAKSSEPRDRTKREHVGSIDRVVWHDDDRPISIIKLTDGKTVTVPAKSTAFVEDLKYIFYGAWEEGKFGPLFRATGYAVQTPYGSTATRKYLTEFCDISPRMANKLYLQYTDQTVQILREDPARVVADGIMNEPEALAASDDLQRMARDERARLDLFELFAGHGIPGTAIDAVLSLWGGQAPDVIRKDPYRLVVRGVPGIGWKRADKLHTALNLPKDRLKRGALAGAYAITEDRTGSTWFPAMYVFNSIADNAPEVSEPMKALKLGLRSGLFRIADCGGVKWIAAGIYAQAEQRVCDHLKRLMRSGVPGLPEVPVTATDGDGLISKHQFEALAIATSKPIGLLTGGPGTGKSYTVAQFLKVVMPAVGAKNLAVVAPTGKAASRISEYMNDQGLGIKARTIHSLLGGGPGGRFDRNARKPLDQRFLIIDESSMIDTPLLSALLEACSDGTRILFVGDPFQLSPVGNGAPLRDMIDSGVIPRGDLTETRRNSGAIVACCRDIKERGACELPTRLDLDAASPVNIRILDSADPLEDIALVLRGMKRFDPVWDCQILVATNEKGDASRKAVNEYFQKLLNPDGQQVSGIPFRQNDKIICTANSTLRVMELRGEKPDMFINYVKSCDECYVANGDIGRVVAVGTSGMIAEFNGNAVLIPKAKGSKSKAGQVDDGAEEPTTGAMSDYELAYGITGHKSQGSQWPCVIVIADKSGGSVADRNWWYTCLSRAEKACVVVGDRGAFVAQVARENMSKRKTFLKELLQEGAGQWK